MRANSDSRFDPGSAGPGDPCIVSCRNCLMKKVWHHFGFLAKPKCPECGAEALVVHPAVPGRDFVLLETRLGGRHVGPAEFRAENSQWHSQRFERSSAPGVTN